MERMAQQSRFCIFLRVSKYRVMYTLTYRSCVSNTSFVLHVPLRGAAREPVGPIVDVHVSYILHTFPGVFKCSDNNISPPRLALHTQS